MSVRKRLSGSTTQTDGQARNIVKAAPDRRVTLCYVVRVSECQGNCDRSTGHTSPYSPPFAFLPFVFFPPLPFLSPFLSSLDKLYDIALYIAAPCSRDLADRLILHTARLRALAGGVRSF